MTSSDDFVDGTPHRPRMSGLDGTAHDADWRPDAGGAKASAHSGNGAEPAADSGSGAGFASTVVRLFEELFGRADGLLEVYADRMRLSVRRALVQAGLGAALAVCAAVWLGTAAWATVHGLCSALGALWGGREWLGDLIGGALALTLAAGGIALGLRVSARRELAGLRTKYERIRSRNAPDQDARVRTEDGDGAPGSRGSSGSAGHR